MLGARILCSCICVCRSDHNVLVNLQQDKCYSLLCNFKISIRMEKCYTLNVREWGILYILGYRQCSFTEVESLQD